MKDYQDYSLSAYNTFGIKARCRRFLEYSDVQEAQHIAGVLKSAAEDFLIVGRGSNLLLTGDFPGIVVHAAVHGIEQLDATTIRCGSGEVWDDVVAWCVAHRLYGAENLSLIPGEVGASAVQNIGAYGVEVKDLIETVEAVEIATGRVLHFSNADCCYAYRDSRFKHDWKNRYLLTHVTYRLSANPQLHLSYGNITTELERRGIAESTAEQLRQVIIDIRNAKLPDPQVMGNAGSFFMNPVVSRQLFEQLLAKYPLMPHYYIDEGHEKIPAGWLIEQCGWKGRSLGRAGVHSRQALVLVNLGGATGSEVVNLCRTVQRDVKEKFGIDIYPEVNIV